MTSAQERNRAERIAGGGLTLLLLALLYTSAAVMEVSPARYAERALVFAPPPPHDPPPPPAATNRSSIPPAEGIAARATVPSAILLERRALVAPVRSTSARPRASVPSPSLEASPAPVDPVARVQHPGPRPQTRAAQRRQTTASARTTLSEIRGFPARTNRPGNNRPLLPLAREPVKRRQTFSAPPRIEEDRPSAAAGAPQPHAVVENIIGWVRKNHAPIPPVVQRHMDYAPGDASAHITWDHEGDRYHIFLMAKRGITQLHAFVVHATRSWYLVDHGLRQEASRARTGTVTWSNGRITFITSSEQPPKGAEVEAIYQLLLLWWNGQAKQ